MRVTLKLYASLMAHLPPQASDRHAVDLDLPEGATVLEALQRQGVPPSQCAIALVDGVWIGAQDRATQVLKPGQTLAVWPPVAGG